jgi:hypothetical protein
METESGVPYVVLNKNRMMDNVQKPNNCSIPLSDMAVMLLHRTEYAFISTTVFY